MLTDRLGGTKKPLVARVPRGVSSEVRSIRAVIRVIRVCRSVGREPKSLDRYIAMTFRAYPLSGLPPRFRILSTVPGPRLYASSASFMLPSYLSTSVRR